MGGIAGVMSGSRGDLPARMTRVMRQRGPGGEVHLSAGSLEPGACLPRTPTARRAQPPAGGEGRDGCVLLDGYVANAPELRARLAARGRPAAATDTELVLGLYEEYGEDFVRLLDGDWALAVVNPDQIFLARDGFGIKPLYYLFQPRRSLFIFASELKALLQCEEFSPELDEEKLTDLIVPGYPVGAGSFVKGVRSVRPGHWLKLRLGPGELRLTEREFFRVSLTPDDTLSFDEAQGRVTELLERAVSSRVPEEGGVGLALSGGLDSTLIALTLQRQKVGRVQTFTVGSDPEHQDLQMARATAARLKSEHHEILVGFDDYVRAIPQFVEALERPLLSVGTAFHLLCGSMAGRVSTCLVGEGADQMFGGGVDYLFDKRVREQLTDGMSRAESLGLGVGEETLQIVAELAGPQPYERYLSNLFRRRLADMFAAGSQLYYACSAKFGIEARDPYLSRELFDFLARVPARFKVNQGLKIDKYLLRHAALGMFGPAMIDAVLCQKRGLGGPFRDYAKRFEELCEASVSDAYLAAHRLGRLNLKKHRLILFDLFELIFLEGRGVCPAGLDMFEFIRERAGAAAARRPTSYATDQAQ